MDEHEASSLPAENAVLRAVHEPTIEAASQDAGIDARVGAGAGPGLAAQADSHSEVASNASLRKTFAGKSSSLRLASTGLQFTTGRSAPCVQLIRVLDCTIPAL